MKIINRLLIVYTLFISVPSLAQTRDLEYIMKNRSYGSVFLDSLNKELKCEVLLFLLDYSGNMDINTTWFGYSDTLLQKEYNRSLAYDPSEVHQYYYCTNEIVALYLINSILQDDFLHVEKIGVVINDKHVTGLIPYHIKFPKKRFLPNRRRYGHYKYRRSQSKNIKIYFEKTKKFVLEKCSAPN
jgi:hypothetical protein